MKRKKKEPVARRRRLSPDVRRVELLEASLRVIQSRGVENTRVEDITKAAGAAKGTFYLYFESWDDLLMDIRSYILSGYVFKMRERFAGIIASNWWKTFEDECLHFIDFIIKLGDLHKAIFHGPIEDHPVETVLSSDTVIAEILEKGIKLGVCHPVRIPDATPLVFSVLHTTADKIVQSGNRAQKTESMLDLLRAWLYRSQSDAKKKVKNTKHI